MNKEPSNDTSTNTPLSSPVHSLLIPTKQSTSVASKSTPIITQSTISTIFPTETGPAFLMVPPPPGFVFRMNDGIWIANKYGNKQLPVNIPTDADSMKFCSTGDYILAEKNFGDIVRGWSSWSTIEVSTGKRVELNQGENQTYCYVTWWPGRCDTLLVNIEPSLNIGRECESFPAILNLNGNITKIGTLASFLGAEAQPSSDGKLLAFTQDNHPWLYKWGIGSNPLTIDNEIFLGGDFGFYRPTWSPDNRQVAWLVSGDLDGKFIEGIGIFNLEDNSSRFLYPYKVWEGEFPSYLIWNPRQDFLLLRTPNGRLSVITDEGVEQFSVEGVVSQNWSPDGEWLAYVLSTGGVRTLYVRSANGEELYKISERSNFVKWSPDSQYLIYKDESSYQIVEVGVWNPINLDLPQDAEFVDWINQ